MKISVLSKRPGELPRHVRVENNLKNLQNYVGGYIETVTLVTDCAVICNEEGRLMEMPYNCTIAGVDFVGPIPICGVAGEEFADLPLAWKECKQVFASLWEV